MGELQEIFAERLDLPNGGHADVLLSDLDNTNSDLGNKSLPNQDQKSPNAPKTYYRTHLHPTYPPPPRQTVDSKPDKKGRERCFNQGQFVPCSSMPRRGLSGVASPKHIKALRKKYGKSSSYHK